MNTLHIKKGDTVVVLSGVERGKSGKVMQAFPKTGLVLVEGVGMRKKHQKPRKEGQKGQIIDKHFPIYVSKVMNTVVQKDRTKVKKTAAKR